jgi:hypothetical protein
VKFEGPGALSWPSKEIQWVISSVVGGSPICCISSGSAISVSKSCFHLSGIGAFSFSLDWKSCFNCSLISSRTCGGSLMISRSLSVLPLTA